MGISLSIVSRMLVLQGKGAMVILPMPRNYATWYTLGDWWVYELLYARSYRRRSMDYGEEKALTCKSRREFYAQWDAEENVRERWRKRNNLKAAHVRSL